MLHRRLRAAAVLCFACAFLWSTSPLAAGGRDGSPVASAAARPAEMPLRGPQLQASDAITLWTPSRTRLELTPRVDGRVSGEFERQSALLLGCTGLLDLAPELLVEIVRETRGRVQVVAVVSSVDEFHAARNLLSANRVPSTQVKFAEIPHDTMWIRDYGPVVARSDRDQVTIIDAIYETSRSGDDRVPSRLADLLGLKVVASPLRIDGGNLLFNGAGLALSTSRLVEDNGLQDSERSALCEAVRRNYGLRQLVLLEPLAGESTGHVDMFTAFTGPQTVVVGKMDPAEDAENAAILDRNAARLAQVGAEKGRLRVVRLPMPPHHDGVWRTYTNVVFANGVLLMPVYRGIHDYARQAAALQIYARLLPGWRIVGLDATPLIESAGALHCITMNLGPLDRLPTFPAPRLTAIPQSVLSLEALVRESGDARLRPAPRRRDR